MSLPALYELAAEYRQQMDALNDLDLDNATIADTLESISGDLEAKCTNVGLAIRNMESLEEQIGNEINRLKANKDRVAARAKGIREYLLQNMQRCEISKIASPWFTLSVRNNPPKVIIHDPASVPQEYMRQPPIPAPEPDKKAIAEALKRGEEVGDCYLEQTQSLIIK